MRDTGTKRAEANIVAAGLVGRVDMLRMRNGNGSIRRGTPARVKLSPIRDLKKMGKGSSEPEPFSFERSHLLGPVNCAHVFP